MCEHENCVCVCKCCHEQPVRASAAALLAPWLVQALRRFASVREVHVGDDPWTHEIVVVYKLITGETATKRIPLEWWFNDRYEEMYARVTEDLRGQNG